MRLILAVLLTYSVSSLALVGEAPRLPESVSQSIRAVLEAADQKRSLGNDLKNNANQLICRWVAEQLRSHSTSEILQGLTPHILVSTNEHLLGWTNRLHLKNVSKTPQISVIFRRLQKDEEEILGLRLDTFDNTLREDGYLDSGPPFIVAKQGGRITTFSFESVSPPFAVPHTYTFLGFVSESGRTGLPDILVSEGPSGSGNFVYFFQVHCDETDGWKVVWKYNCPHVTSVKYFPEKHVLALEYYPDRASKRQKVALTLRWGGRSE